ncbi:hypothetical protein JCM8097_002095 [Rhodosporidiobolus ruineniae]
MTATRTTHAPPPPALVDALKAAHVPVESFEEACRACGDCDDDADVEDYPKGFDVDLDSTMLGEMKAFGRQILVSTGKSDWPHNVCEDSKDIPGLVEAAYGEAEKSGDKSGRPGLLSKLSSKLLGGGKGDAGPPGVHPSSAALPPDTAPSSKLTILASSFISSSHEGHKESVIVLPDFKVVENVAPTKEDANELVQRYLVPEAGRAGTAEAGTLKSWPLPYHAVVLLCSHKKRDKRCHISAPLLISQFHHHLEKHGFHVDERGDDLADGPSIEEWADTVEERELRLKETLQGVKKDDGRVGLFKVSHLGGHKFAGNVIIFFPSGSCVWYGRATPKDVGIIVDRTILGGKVIPELLRGGLGLAGKDGEKGVLEW